MNYIIFICSHNAGRSQMAEAFFNTEKKKFPYVDIHYQAISAGMEPRKHINPNVIKSMQEVGIDISNDSLYFPKSFEDDHITTKETKVKWAIVVCDTECEHPFNVDNIFYANWSIPIPYQRSLATVRKIRETVHKKVIEFLEELAAEVKHTGKSHIATYKSDH